jgi:hypothetical protein
MRSAQATPALAKFSGCRRSQARSCTSRLCARSPRTCAPPTAGFTLAAGVPARERAASAVASASGIVAAQLFAGEATFTFSLRSGSTAEQDTARVQLLREVVLGGAQGVGPVGARERAARQLLVHRGRAKYWNSSDVDDMCLRGMEEARAAVVVMSESESEESGGGGGGCAAGARAGRRDDSDAGQGAAKRARR